MTPFEIMAQDCDEVIMLLNYFLQKAENEPPAPQQRNSRNGSGQQYIHVNDNTATGGWW